MGAVYHVDEATDLVASNWTKVVGGLVGSGGTMSATVVVANATAALRVAEEVTPPPVTVFADDFENGVNGWTFGFDGDAATEWELGTPATTGPAGANSRTNCWGTNIDADYDYGAECWLRSPAIDLTGAGAATLSWQQAVDIEPDLAAYLRLGRGQYPRCRQRGADQRIGRKDRRGGPGSALEGLRSNPWPVPSAT